MKRQMEEIHQPVEPLSRKARKMRFVEFTVRLGGQPRKKRMLTRAEGKARDIPVRDRFSVERNGSLKTDKTKNTLHQRRLSRSVLSEQTDNLSARQSETDVAQSLLSHIFFSNVTELDHIITLHSFCHWCGVKHSCGVAS